MRHSMTNHIFKEHNNMVTHTAASKLLSEEPLMRAWAEMICEESWPAAAQVRQPKMIKFIEYPLIRVIDHCCPKMVARVPGARAHGSALSFTCSVSSRLTDV